jgi:hypothetical protein
MRVSLLELLVKGIETLAAAPQNFLIAQAPLLPQPFNTRSMPMHSVVTAGSGYGL